MIQNFYFKFIENNFYLFQFFLAMQHPYTCIKGHKEAKYISEDISRISSQMLTILNQFLTHLFKF